MKVFFQPISLPLHSNELTYPKDGKNEEYQTLNTRHSTNPTPRQQSHDRIQLRNSGLFKSRNHITVMESPVKRQENPARYDKNLGLSRQQGGNQRLFKSLKSIPYVKSREHQSRQRTGRRKKIFENRDGSREKMKEQAKPLVTIQYQNQSNVYRNGPSVSSLNYFQSGKVGAQFRVEAGSQHGKDQQRCAQRQNSHGFISGIREQTSRLVRVNSSNIPFNQPPNLSNSSLNTQTPSKVTFSYNNQTLNTSVAHQISQPLPKPIPAYQPIYASLPYQPPSTNINFIKPIEIHQNPILNKIKKPNPTHTAYRKGTLIDQISYENVSTSKVQKVNSFDYHGYNQYQQYNSVGSKVSLGSNIKDSIMGGRSLATDKLKIGDSFSNISQDNSNQRYFDDQEGEDMIFKQRISYKDIKIENQNEENVQNWQQINAQNIFCDFQQSRRNENEHSLQKQKKSPFFTTQPLLTTSKPHQPQQILEKSTLILKSQPKKLDINFPLLLIIISSLLLLLQLLN